MHKLLARQLRRAGVSTDALDPTIRRLLDLVDEAYRQADVDRLLVERSLELTSQELLGRNRRLEEELSVRHAAEAALRASEERYRVLFDASPYSVLAFDPRTLRIVESNQAAVDMYGYSRVELACMTLLELKVDGDDPDLHDVSRMSAERFRGLKRHRRKDGAILEVEVRSHLVVLDGRRVVLTMGTDVTQTRRLEAELRQAQKMEAIGRLAGGVAHDFNNMLAVILSGAHLASYELEDDHPARAEIAEMESAAQRAAALTRQLLTFSRQHPRRPCVLELDSVVADMQRMLARVIGEDIQLSAEVAGGIDSVEVDPSQIEQVLLNLVVNARDAMPRGGRVVIQTANVRLDARQAAEIGTQPGDYVMLAVRDTGCGMDAATKLRIFEPFFTTKDVGRGTGLGLATVFGIVKQAGGGIRVESAPGRGATFELYFPAVTSRARSSRPASHTPDAGRGAGTILLVEDEDQVRAVVGRLIVARGYEVVPASGPEVALALLRERAVDLVVTDLVMPDLDGRSMVERMRAIRPEVKVLYMSGYSEHAAVAAGGVGACEHFIQKPFTAQQMAAAVRRALGAPSSRPPGSP